MSSVHTHLRTTRAVATAICTLAALAVVVGGLAAMRPPQAQSAIEVEPIVEVALPDTDRTVTELAGLVRAIAATVPGGEPDRDVRVVFTDEVPGGDHEPFVAGRQAGSTVWVRIGGTAMPTRTLVHELAHAFTPGDEHGPRFRAVYLAAMSEVYDEATARREGRRLAWVYDRCYLDDSCPVLERSPAG